MRSVVEDGVGDLFENNDLVNGEKYLGLFLNSTKACWKLIFASYILVFHDLDDASNASIIEVLLRHVLVFSPRPLFTFIIARLLLPFLLVHFIARG